MPSGDMTMRLVGAAQDYARRGWRVIPRAHPTPSIAEERPVSACPTADAVLDGHAYTWHACDQCCLPNDLCPGHAE